eukprot:5607528-Prymnesium_polylepis.2
MAGRLAGRLIAVRRLSSRPLTHAPRKALGSKRHLEYTDGEDGNSIFTRQRQTLERRAQQAMSAATDYQMPKETMEAREAHARAKLRSSSGGRDYLVENEIQRALAEGELDDLSGSFAPLRQRDENPFEDLAGLTVVHRVLKNHGSGPPWVEQHKLIKVGLAASRQQLARHYFEMLVEQSRADAADERDPDEPPKPDWGKSDAARAEAAARTEAVRAELTEEAWPAAMATFEEEIRGLNKDVRKFNLIVPSAWQQQPLFSPERELEKALIEFEQLADEQRKAMLERARRRTAHRERLRNRQPVNPFAFGATWRLTNSEPMPSMFVALKEILVALLGSSASSRRR